MQTLLLPTYCASIATFADIYQSQSICMNENAKWNKNLHLNRCTVLSSQGNLFLSVPLAGGRNQKTLLKDMKIFYGDNWILHHQKTLQTCYAKAPWFDYLIDDFKEILNQKHSYLLDLNLALLSHFMNCLEQPFRIDATKNIKIKEDKTIATDLLYHQVFENKKGNNADISILDLLFNEGKNARQLLTSS